MLQSHWGRLFGSKKNIPGRFHVMSITTKVCNLHGGKFWIWHIFCPGMFTTPSHTSILTSLHHLKFRVLPCWCLMTSFLPFPCVISKHSLEPFSPTECPISNYWVFNENTTLDKPIITSFAHSHSYTTYWQIRVFLQWYSFKVRSDRASAAAAASSLVMDYIDLYLCHSDQAAAAVASLAMTLVMTLGITLAPIWIFDANDAAAAEARSEGALNGTWCHDIIKS